MAWSVFLPKFCNCGVYVLIHTFIDRGGSDDEGKKAVPSNLSKKALGLEYEKKMWSDASYAKEMERLYERLAELEVERARQQQDAELRRDMPIVSTPGGM